LRGGVLLCSVANLMSGVEGREKQGRPAMEIGIFRATRIGKEHSSRRGKKGQSKSARRKALIITSVEKKEVQIQKDFFTKNMQYTLGGGTQKRKG